MKTSLVNVTAAAAVVAAVNTKGTCFPYVDNNNLSLTV